MKNKIIMLVAVLLAVTGTCMAQQTVVSSQYLMSSTGTASISPSNVMTVSAGVDAYSSGFNTQYSENQSVSIKIDALSATSFSMESQAYAKDATGAEYWESTVPSNTITFTGSIESRYALSLPVGVAFRFKFTADAAQNFEIERLQVHYK